MNLLRRIYYEGYFIQFYTMIFLKFQILYNFPNIDLIMKGLLKMIPYTAIEISVIYIMQ